MWNLNLDLFLTFPKQQCISQIIISLTMTQNPHFLALCKSKTLSMHTFHNLMIVCHEDYPFSQGLNVFCFHWPIRICGEGAYIVTCNNCQLCFCCLLPVKKRIYSYYVDRQQLSNLSLQMNVFCFHGPIHIWVEREPTLSNATIVRYVFVVCFLRGIQNFPYLEDRRQ